MEGKVLAESVVLGKPCTQGSMGSFTSKSTGKIVTPQNKRLISWRQEAKHALWQSFKQHCGATPTSTVEPVTCDVELRATFVYERPKCHFYWSKKRYGQLRDDAPSRPSEKVYGDLDKLLRAVGDSLTGIVLKDDGLICKITSEKTFGEPASVVITIVALDWTEESWPWVPRS